MVASVNGSEASKAIGSVELLGADAPHRELIAALGDTREIMARILASQDESGKEIITLLGGAGAAAFSQYPKLRVESITVCNAGATALINLTVGNAVYAFAAGPGTQTFNFPLVIERGMNISVDLAASIVYLIGIPE